MKPSKLCPITNLDAFLVLNAISGLGPVRIAKLISYFKTPQKVLSVSAKDLVASGIVPPKIAGNIEEFEADAFLEKEYELIKRHNVEVICLNDKSYSELLKEIADPPPVLYVKGKIKKQDDMAIAIVGSRRASIYGVSVAEKFSAGFCDYGITVVSGMARGIDTAAHRGALRARGRTIAVLGSGLARIYPAENKKIFDAIADAGAVISEFPMQTAPLACNFPRRNRIVSGLSLGVIVVEAAKRSGALITADFALEQGKDVFAVPGQVDSPSSLGVNDLIKQGAKLISNVYDVIEELGLELKRSVSSQDEENLKDFSGLSDQEREVLKRISSKGIHIDQLALECQITTAKLSAALLSLSLKKRIKQLPGKLFAQT
ncbi:MAG: DNA-processing protein DprA [Candidatus Aceula meridiana]|nr:DNA-processing protein DprA [Candidatus Aceula meridiana]